MFFFIGMGVGKNSIFLRFFYILYLFSSLDQKFTIYQHLISKNFINDVDSIINEEVTVKNDFEFFEAK